MSKISAALLSITTAFVSNAAWAVVNLDTSSGSSGGGSTSSSGGQAFSVPEPGTLGIVALGLAAVLIAARLRDKK